MNELYFATPRSGSHAICSMSVSQRKLLEYFNIEDMILPRNVDGNLILYNLIEPQTLDFLERGLFEDAWNTQKLNTKDNEQTYYKIIKKGYSYLNDSFPELDVFTNEHQTRWDYLKSIPESWSVKIMQYHYVDGQVLHEICDRADKINFIQRKDLVAQAISTVKAQNLPDNVWHTTTEQTVKLTTQLSYKPIIDQIESILQENHWITKTLTDYNHKVNTIYYEDVDFSNSLYKKLTIETPDFNTQECYEAAKEAGYDYTSYLL
tara:strand:+ start:148 stop:936 length:789 start_codon:yes stop_codon:yes gene_type:complete